MRLGSAIADKIIDDSLKPSEISDLNRQMSDLQSLQSRVDDAIASVTDPVAKARLEEKKAEARSFFNDYVLPAYMKVYDLATSVQSTAESAASTATSTVKSWWSDLFSGDFGNTRIEPYHMGALPLLPIAYVAAIGIVALSGTAIYYINQQAAREQAILDDPAFTPEQKKALIEGGSLYGILGQAKWLVIAAAVGGVAYIYLKGKNK